MALQSQNITKVCKYWSVNEPEVCIHWDGVNLKCVNGNEIHPTHFPDCNLIGTAHQCNLYTGNKIEARCILPDPLRGGINRKTGQKWITRDPANKDKFIGFDDITCYGEEGFCDGDPESKGNGYGSGDGLSSRCAGYNPNELEFGNYFNELPLDLQIFNLCARLGRCVWWASNPFAFSLDDDGGIVYPTSMCVHTDAKAKEFETIRFNEELGIFILPCNGAASSCPFYTGIKWEYCVIDKLYPGCKILAEQIQEIRYYLKKNNWTEKSFSEAFYEPIIYAWDKSKGYQIDETINENKNSTNIFFPQTNQTPSVVSVIEVKIPKFLSFNLEFRNIELTKGTKEKEINIDYPTFIEQLPSLSSLPPLILNKFDTEEGDEEEGEEDNNEEKSEEVSEEKEKTNIFELVDIHDNTILLIGETRYYNSKPYAVNLTLEAITDFPIELHMYESLFNIKKNVSSEAYNIIYKQINDRLTYYINYNQKPLGINNTPKIENGVVGGEFFINVETVIGDNTILIFDKGSGYWEYSKINVKKNYHGVVIAQTEFYVESTGKNIEFPPYYPTSFCGIENKNHIVDNKRISFELKTFGGGKTEIANVYNDYVIENDYNGKKYEAGYIPYEVTIYEEIELRYDDGNILPIGNAGYLLLIIPDEDKLLHSVYRPWEIKNKNGVKLKLEYNLVKQKIDKDGGVLKGQKTIAQLKKEADDKAFDIEVFMTGGKYLPNNQLIVKPNDIYKINSVGPGCFISIKKIVVYDKRSFVEEGGDQKAKYEELKNNDRETDYIKQSVDIDGEDEVISKDDVFFKGETKFKLIEKIRGKFTSITDETLFIAVVFKSILTGRILGVTRTKMIVWVRHPSCRAVPIFYKWGTEYEEFDLVPLQYYRFDAIGILKRPAKDSYINIKYTPGYGEFLMHPFIFAPSTALYVMDPDVLIFLEANPEDYVIEYYRTMLLSELKTVYENDYASDDPDKLSDAPWEYTKVIKVNDPKLLTFKPDDIEHGYYDMCKLSNPKNNVSIWTTKPFGGYMSFCLSNFGPANLIGKNPPDFIGAALYYAGISIKYYEYCMDGWSPGIAEIGLSLFTTEYNFGKFGGGHREVMDSYRSVDNVCYDTGIVEFKENFKDMIAFEKFKSQGHLSKLKEDLHNQFIKMDNQEYFFRKWMPMYNTFSASDLNSNLIGYPFNEYTFDLKSPYYHPFSIYTVKNIDGVFINEIVKSENPEPPEGYDPEIDGEYVASKFKKFKFDEIFNCESFETTFLGEMKFDGTYDEFEGATGITYPNISGQEIDYPNKVWLTFKGIEGEEGEEEGEESMPTESIQWIWREKEAIVDRYINKNDLKDHVNDLIKEQNEGFDFNKVTINSPYVMVGDDEKNVTGIFQWLPIKHPVYFFDYKLKEWDLTVENAEDSGTQINLLFLEDEKDVPRPGIFFIQLNDGPPRGIKKNGDFDPDEMLTMKSINNFNIPELYTLYTICNKPPWSSKVTLFGTGYESIDEQEAIDDDRYYYLEKPYVEVGATIDNKQIFHRGLDIGAVVPDGFDELGQPKFLSCLENFNGKDLPSIKKLIEKEKYEIKMSHSPEKKETNSSYTSIEPNEWFPNADYCYNIVYKDDECPSLDLFFKFSEQKDISKIVCKFKCGKKKVGEDVEWTEKKIITDNLFNEPGVQIKVNNKVVYLSDNIKFHVEGNKDEDNKKKKNYINGDVEDSVIGFVDYVDKNDDIENLIKTYEWPVNLLEDTFRSKELTISFRLDPNFTELKNVNLIDTKYIFENKNEIIYTKHCLHLDCIYLYDSTLVNSYEKIKVNNKGYFISTGKHGDFQPNKFDVSNIERAFLKTGHGKERIPTLTQVDNFDGMIFYPDSDVECTSISKCRGRLMGEVQKKEKESFVTDGEVEGSSSSGKKKKTLPMCEKRQNELYQAAIDKGSTEFYMQSMCPPGLQLILDDLDIEFPIWQCKFTNKIVLPLCEPLNIKPIEPEGYYFDWGLDNIIKRPCFMKRTGWLDQTGIDCFDGYKLRSYYDDDKIIGVSMAEIWATSPGAGFVNRTPVQQRIPALHQSGWTEKREKADDENKDFFDTLIVLQSKHALTQQTMRIDNENEIEELKNNNTTTLNNLFIEYSTKIDAEEDAAKVNMEIEYVTKKYDIVIEQQTILSDTNIIQITKWSELIVTQYAEIAAKKLVFITPMGGSFKFTDEISFQKKFDFDTQQTIKRLELEIKYDLKKLKKEKKCDIKIVELKLRDDYNVPEIESEIIERTEKQEILENKYIDLLNDLNDKYNNEKEKLIEEQKDEKEEYYKDNGIKELSSDDTDTVRYVTEAMYGYGTQAEDKDFMFADIKSMSDVIVNIGPKQCDLEEYGEGELFKVQQEAYYNLLKEKELTTEIFPAPIMAYYIKKKES